MGILGEGQSIPATEPGICYCYCIVTDNVTGETATSEYCEVYSVEPFTLVYLTGDGEHDPDGSGILVSEFKGGVMPYEIWWDKDGEQIESSPGEVNENYGSVVYNATVGDYTVHATDAMGEVITATSHRIAPKLTIVEQPVGGTIPKDGVVYLYVQVGDGEGPYYYTLYHNGKEHVKGDSQTAVRYSFRVWYPG